MTPSATLNTHQAQVMHILKQKVYGFSEAHDLVLRFQTMLKDGHLHHLAQWINAAAKLEIYALQRFATALAAMARAAIPEARIHSIDDFRSLGGAADRLKG